MEGAVDDTNLAFTISDLAIDFNQVQQIPLSGPQPHPIPIISISSTKRPSRVPYHRIAIAGRVHDHGAFTGLS